MIRLITAALVVLLVACGGGGGGGGGGAPTTNPTLMALFPVQDLSVGTDYTYTLTKTTTTGTFVETKTLTRTFEVGRTLSPLGPDLNLVGLDGATSMGAGLLWTARGLELSAYMQTTWWNTEGVCVTLASPGLLLIPGDFAPGDTHQCSGLGLFVDSASVTWVGAEAVAGHPDAQRFDFRASAPYSNTTPFHSREGATSHSITSTVYLVPGLGPVQGTVTQQFLTGVVLVQERKYEFALVSTTPGP